MDNKILIAEDDEDIIGLLKLYLEKDGYELILANDGEEAFAKVLQNDISLAILDIMMPKLDGMRTCLKIRESRNIPIILLSAKSEDSDKILGLNIGADDYVTKPFNHLELVARVKSQLRRYDYPLNRENTQDLIVIKDLTIDTVNKQVSLRGENIKLTATEYKILTLLASHPGRIFSIKEIYERVWEEPFYKSENTVTVHIRRMREKIEINSKEPEYIKVVWGLGYKIDK